MSTPVITDTDLIQFGLRCAERIARRLNAGNARSFARSSIGHRLADAREGDELPAVLALVERANLGLPTGFAQVISENPAHTLRMLRIGVASLPGDDE